MLSLICGIALGLQNAHPLLMNGGFDDGLAGWKAEGAARVVEKALKIGPGKGAVRRRYDVPGLRVLLFSATLAPSAPEVATQIRLQCFDRRGRLLMDLKASPDLKNGAGIYTKTQANTAYVVLSIEKNSDAGTLVADDAVLKDDDRDRVEHPPQVDLDAAMRPIWKGNEVWDESVLLLAEGERAASGRLLFRPTKIKGVKDEAQGKTFVEGKDYRIEGDRIFAVKGSSIPIMRDTEFAKGEFPWTRLDGRHVFVTYEHGETWHGPVPSYQGDRLQETTRKLRDKKPVKIVAFGDSITQGVNVSGFRNVPPYLPPWPTLFGRELGRMTGNKRIHVVNAALGGMTIDWAKDNARDAVASLDPDLVLIGFGMNDFWSYSPADFRKYVAATMATIRARRPKCEFVLITSMKFDPAYTKDPTYVGNLAGYAEELRKMAGPGVALFDMTAISEALYQAKSAKDLTTDPMHPDDFLSRWYAQGMVATVAKSD